MTNLDNDLNSTIASAVNARIEAAVLQALGSDDVLRQYVAAALNQPIEVGSNYTKVKTTYLNHAVKTAIQEATKAAVMKILTEDHELIEAQVKKALRARVGDMAKGIGDALADQATNRYRVNIEVKVPGD